MQRGIPEDWYTGKASSLGGSDQSPQSQLSGNLGSQNSENRNLISGQLPKQNIDAAALPQVSLSSSSSLSKSHQRQPVLEGKGMDGESTSTATSVTAPPAKVESSSAATAPLWLRWSKNWLFWGVVASMISGTVGFVSVAMLLKLPSAPKCPAIFWPLASASVRLHCAEVAANRQTVADLLQAIALVEALPKDHALRSEINQSIVQWSGDIMALAEAEFQAGQLPEAIAMARQIPADTPAHSDVEKQISRWESIWSEGEGIYQQAEAEVRQQQWRQAFMATVKLLNLENNYWATTKYEELNRLIETTRLDANKINQAQDLENSNRVDDLVKAVKLAESIGASSFLYQEAQALIPQVGRRMLDLAQAALDRQDAQVALDIANRIPASTGLEAETQDFVIMADAWRNAWVGTVPSLENAIIIAQRLGSDRPSYNQAQELISRWQLEIEDVAHLERARELAQGGTPGDFSAAIAEAELIPRSNPRGTEARQQINNWQQQIETIEDRPILQRAEDIAIYDDINSLQAAIDEAGRISNGRALYPEARQKIRLWTSKIERIQDQPYLDQARILASEGNLPGAIAAAQQISPGRALSGEAQAAVSDWQGQIRARQNWQSARQVALQNTPDALAQAINLAQQVPTTSPLRYTVEPAISQWSQQILRFAQFRGRYDVPGGIEIAKKVPSNTDAFRSAQEQIAAWERVLNPVPVPVPSPAAATDANPAPAEPPQSPETDD